MDLNSNQENIDEALVPLSELVDKMADLDGLEVDRRLGITMKINQAKLGMPVQLDILVGDNGQVTLGSSPPLYYVETTVMPVFHQLKINVQRSQSSDGTDKHQYL